eukprot:CAMPEP_0173209344 /NCGR_PEP_ID=MMETSP1141-20130122/23044_1 /TAXON_ID=483371 /ORGANISM="non described non described, Strain CCMP2298" /LENGTH=100 /DNA_ID=CAMNT_0014135945 /DNA_START=221 /DNA_END=523 /DNA_ORIENTATION=-
MKETYNVPKPDPGNRYYIRLLEPAEKEKRHVITRLMRYLPDMSWDTAEGVVQTAIEEGISLVRVVNSQSQAKDLVDLLAKADPPVITEVWDAKTAEVIIL